MTYRIQGIDPAPFAHLSRLDEGELRRRGAMRVLADSKPGFPCRVTLEDAEPGDSLLLVNYCSHEGNNPYRSTHAIFLREGAQRPSRYVDAVPPVFATRILSLRAFAEGGMMHDAALAGPGEADAAIRGLLADPLVHHLDVHNAVRGCFAARVDRS